MNLEQERDAALAREAALRDFAEWCVRLAEFRSITLAPVIVRARAALAASLSVAEAEKVES